MILFEVNVPVGVARRYGAKVAGVVPLVLKAICSPLSTRPLLLRSTHVNRFLGLAEISLSASFLPASQIPFICRRSTPSALQSSAVVLSFIPSPSLSTYRKILALPSESTQVSTMLSSV